MQDPQSSGGQWNVRRWPPWRSWLVPVVVLGVGYALVGISFALPSTHARAWRLAAWTASAAAFAGHILYERVRLHHAPLRAAFHVALAAALGAFGLAVGANIHSLYVESTRSHRQLLLLSLGIWPVMTGLPAFLVALGASIALARVTALSRR